MPIALTKQTRNRRSASESRRRGLRTKLTAAIPLAVAALLAVTPLAAPGASAAAPAGVFASDVKPSIPAADDKNSVELGVKFTVASTGVVTGIEYYSTPANRGTHVGSLWDSDGKRLASVTFPSSTRSGWLSADFTKPVAVQAGKSYVASYLAPQGGYAVTENFFTSPYTSDGATFPRNAGVYKYGSGGYPTQVYKASNYLVDVLYRPDSSSPTPTATSTPRPTSTPTPTPTPTRTATPRPTATPTATTPPPAAPTPSAPQAPGGSGQKNCINVPSACGYPDETNTGVKPGSALTRVPQDATSGPGWSYRSDIRTVQTTGNGATLENLSIAGGSIIVLHSGVTLRNVYVQSNDYYPINCVYSGATRDADSCLGLTAENVEIAGTANCQAAMAFNGYTARRVYVHGCLDGFKANSDVVIEDSYVTDLAVVAGSHNDGVQSTAQGNLTFRHNTFKLGNQSGINAVFQMGMKDRVGTGVTIENSLIDGGAYMLNSTPISGVLIKDNRFTRRSTWGIGEVKGGSWVGNYWDDTLALVSQNG